MDNRLILIRGLPGSGKAALAQKSLVGMRDGLIPSHMIFSAEKFFVDLDGEFHFESIRWPEAHRDCQQQIRIAMYHGVAQIIVHNIFSCRYQMVAYIQMAQDRNYPVEVIDLFDNNLSDQELAERNRWKVPKEYIQRLRNSWEH